MDLKFCSVFLLLILAATALGAAFDSAADPAYIAGWQNGTNGGTGFDAWRITISNEARTGHLIGDASTNGGNSDLPGSSGGSINSSGKSFELFAVPPSGGEGRPPERVDAQRGFNSPLGIGQTFQIEFDFPRKGALFISLPGFQLTASARDIGQLPHYAIYDNGASVGGRDTNVVSTSDGGRLEFTRTGIATYSATVSDVGSLQSGTLSGTLDNFGQELDHFEVEVFNSGPRGPGSAFFNNIAVTPEPGSFMVLSFVAGSMLLRRSSRASA